MEFNLAGQLYGVTSNTEFKVAQIVLTTERIQTLLRKTRAWVLKVDKVHNDLCSIQFWDDDLTCGSAFRAREPGRMAVTTDARLWYCGDNVTITDEESRDDATTILNVDTNGIWWEVLPGDTDLMFTTPVLEWHRLEDMSYGRMPFPHATQLRRHCVECGHPVNVTPAGIAYHLTNDGQNIDHDLDHHHVAVPEE
jgi:hypothetical protein